MVVTVEPYRAAVPTGMSPGLDWAGRPTPRVEIAHRRLYLTVVEALEHGELRVVMDCSNWETLDIRLLSSLVRCARTCAERGASFQLLNLRDSLSTCIRELRFDRLIGLENQPANVA